MHTWPVIRMPGCVRVYSLVAFSLDRSVRLIGQTNAGDHIVEACRNLSCLPHLWGE